MSYVETTGEHTQIEPKHKRPDMDGLLIACDCGQRYCKGQVVIPWDELAKIALAIGAWAWHHERAKEQEEYNRLQDAAEKRYG